MVRAVKLIILACGALAVNASRDQAFADDSQACTNGSLSAESKLYAHSRIATDERPAAVTPKAGPNFISESPALRLTLRAKVVASHSQFLVAVFLGHNCDKDGDRGGQFIGTVAFLDPKIGQSEIFVLPAPEHGFPSIPPGDVKLTVELVSAVAPDPTRPLERPLENVAVEVLDAEFAK